MRVAQCKRRARRKEFSVKAMLAVAKYAVDGSVKCHETEVRCLSSFKESNCTPRSCTSLKFSGFLGICMQERSGLISLVYLFPLA